MPRRYRRIQRCSWHFLLNAQSTLRIRGSNNVAQRPTTAHPDRAHAQRGAATMLAGPLSVLLAVYLLYRPCLEVVATEHAASQKHLSKAALVWPRPTFRP